nr:protein trichome birefringence-like 23 [Ipomoea batatas]GMD10464.1 protein trichome birefringence-like 23 [Ipomoea batatas]
MVGDWKSSWWRSLSKQNHLIVKLAISVLLAGLAFRLLFSRSIDIPDGAETEIIFLEDGVASAPSLQLSVAPSTVVDQVAPTDEQNVEQCDLFVGDWVPNPRGPAYTNDSCKFIENHQNCMLNGRPDKGYLYWRWSPRDCELRQFNPKKFLELMRDKNWALIGDSISRNHVQSILCMLSRVEEPIEVYHDGDYKSRRWFFPSYNFSISVFWSPFLAEAAIFEDINGVSSSEIELHLDRLDKNWTRYFDGLDYVVFSSGEWFVKTAVYFKNDTIIGCHLCPKRNLTELGFDFAYREVLRSFFDYIISSKHKGMIFFRTTTPEHFEHGEWFSGGTCNRTEPAREGDFKLSEIHRILREVELQEFEKVSANATEAGVKLKLFDITPLSLLRPDGHPGPYRFYQPFADGKNGTGINDCLHWCLPGPIDSWNDLLMEMLRCG